MKVDSMRTMLDFSKPYTKSAAEIQEVQESMRVTNNPMTISEVMEAEVKNRATTANIDFSVAGQANDLMKVSGSTLNIKV